MRRRVAISVAALGVLAGVMPHAQSPRSGLDVAGFDRTVLPQDDLYRYVNGGWVSRGAMPADRVRYGAFMGIGGRTQLPLRRIIEEVAGRAKTPRGANAHPTADAFPSVVAQTATD